MKSKSTKANLGKGKTTNENKCKQCGFLGDGKETVSLVSWNVCQKETQQP